MLNYIQLKKRLKIIVEFYRKCRLGNLMWLCRIKKLCPFPWHLTV